MLKVFVAGLSLLASGAALATDGGAIDRDLWDRLKETLPNLSMPLVSHQSIQGAIGAVEGEQARRDQARAAEKSRLEKLDPK